MCTQPSILLNADFIKGWHRCQLEVMECRKVPWPTTVIQDKYCVEDCGWPSQDHAYECKINLLTGKTHQVCELSFLCIACAFTEASYFVNQLIDNSYFISPCKLRSGSLATLFCVIVSHAFVN